jgi:polyvinyl alcohol dehydrogenase (cytochrome)
MSLNAKTGSLNWYYQTYTGQGTGDDLDFGSTPNLFSISVNGVVHSAVGLGSKDGYYYIVDRVTGSLLEKVLIGTGGSDGGIVGAAGFINLGPNNPEVFIPSFNAQIGGEYGVLKALTPSNGTVRWQFNTPVTLLGSVAIVPGAVLFGDEKGDFYAVSTASGQQLFHTTVPGAIEGGISVAEGLVFVPMSFGSGSSGALYAYG